VAARFTGAAIEGVPPAPTKEDDMSSNPSPEYIDPVGLPPEKWSSLK